MPCKTYKNVVVRDSDGTERMMDVHAFNGYQIHPRWLLLIPIFALGLGWFILSR